MTRTDFSDFFLALWGYDPFPWQVSLAHRVCDGEWPDYLAVPTGSGKTACIDIAVFALALQAALPVAERGAGRRIFFIVNRRVIVDEAYERARVIAKRLDDEDSKEPIIKEVAKALRSLSPADQVDNTPPLDCVQLRGAIYRDNRWARSLTQPTIITSTIDQVGSRLLFRGYGLSPSACPLHAALVANDSLLLLDEAHISRPFVQTVRWVSRFRKVSQSSEAVGENSLQTPFHCVQMTATPPADADDVVRIDEADKTHPVLARRLTCSKPARIALAQKVKGKKAIETLARAIYDESIRVIEDQRPRSIAVMVNRVATAREVARLLETKFGYDRVVLMIGRMRPIDRDELTREISTHLKTGNLQHRGVEDGLGVRIVVATQCLEVGADLDFDALVTECASLDSLRQRFGRLNRAGRDIEPLAVIVMRGDLVEPLESKLDEAESKGRPLDPIYGNTVSRTWNWLNSVAVDGFVDFGIEAMGARVDRLAPDQLERLFAPTQDAPILFPAYLDAWAQTNPRPAHDPDPAIFLHGPNAGRPDVLVCWRADLPDDDADDTAWLHAVSLCPPSTPESLSVPLYLLREWLFQDSKVEDRTGDLLGDLNSGEVDVGSRTKREPRMSALIWRGLADSRFAREPEDLRQGDTIVLPVRAGGWTIMGHLPSAPVDPANLSDEEALEQSDLSFVDIGSEAFRLSRDREILRLRREFFSDGISSNALKELIEWARDPESDWTKARIRECLQAVVDEDGGDSDMFRRSVRNLIELDFTYTRYADLRGVVLVSRKRLRKTDTSLIALGDEDESLSAVDEAIPLADHLNHVLQRVESVVSCLPLGPFREALRVAARLHDWGKLDERFQALLLRGDPNAAFALGEPLAKSPNLSLTARERNLARQRAGLPVGFRHEALSVLLAESSDEKRQLPEDSALAELALHLIGSHHGHCRPFAPVVVDNNPPPIESITLHGHLVPSLTIQERVQRAPHRLDSGVSDRFWRLTRRYGWWGLAYLEAALRLADQQASEDEVTGRSNFRDKPEIQSAHR